MFIQGNGVFDAMPEWQASQSPSYSSVSLSFSNHNLIAFTFPCLLDIGVPFELVELVVVEFGLALRSWQTSSASMPAVAPLSGTEDRGAGGVDWSGIASGSFSWTSVRHEKWSKPSDHRWRTSINALIILRLGQETDGRGSPDWGSL